MNTHTTTPPARRPRHISALAALAAIATLSMTFVPTAHGHQEIPVGGSSATATPTDVVDHVTERKAQMARDRIERPWLHG